MVQRLSCECRQVVRRLLRRPLFALAIVLILALGIGPLTAIASMSNAVLFRPWQVEDPDSVAVLRPKQSALEAGPISVAEYRYFREHATTVSSFAAVLTASLSLDDGTGQELPIRSSFVSFDYFEALGIGVAAGRTLTAADEDYLTPNAVAIISDQLWARLFGRSASLIGRELRVSGIPVRIVGVAERGFGGVERRGPFGTELWMPLPSRALQRQGSANLARFSDPRGYSLRMLASRLKQGQTREAAAAEFSVLSARFRTSAGLAAREIDAVDTTPFSQAPAALQGVISVHTTLLLALLPTLIIACVNAGGLLLGDTMSRERDIAIQLSLGATPSQVRRELLMQAALLSVVAAVVGLIVANYLPRLMLRLGFGFGVSGFERVSSGASALGSFYSPDATVLVVAVILTGLTTLLAVAAPGWRVGRISVTLLGGGRHGRTSRQARLRAGILSAQVAVTMTLLIAATTLTRATSNVAGLSPGFMVRDIQIVSMQVGGEAGAQPARRRNYYRHLMAAMDSAGLGPVALSDQPLLSEVSLVMMARRSDQAPAESRPIPLRLVTRNYFDVLGINVVRGQIPTSDTDSHELVVNETAARLLFPGADPLGQTVMSAVSPTDFEDFRVVGVVKDTPVRWMSEIGAVIYQSPSYLPQAQLILRSPSTAVIDRVRSLSSGLEQNVTMTVRPLSEFVRESMTAAVLATRGAWALGLLGLVLALSGAFGVFSNEVRERRQEIGIRRAIGAGSKDVVKVLLRTAQRSVMWGLAAGFAFSLALVPLLDHFLYGLKPFDPIAYLQVAVMLVVAVLLAMWIPARRAISVDPSQVLRGN